MTRPPAAAGLKILSGERAGFVLYPLTVDTLIGRLDAVDVFLPDHRCSRKHCLIHWVGPDFVVVDLSANGTFLNDVRLSATTETPLSTGDRIRVGGTELEFRLAETATPATPVAELEFDFSEQTDDGTGGLHKVFDSDPSTWSSTSTQRMPRVPPQEPG